MFGKKKDSGLTVALVDIESGSVGAALTRISRDDAPKIFGETRVSIPLSSSRNTVALASEIERATREALAHISGVAARMRSNGIVAEQGEVEHAALFFSPPWAKMHLSGGTADYMESMRHSVQKEVADVFGYISTTHHPLGTAAAHTSARIVVDGHPFILCIVGREVTELLVVSPQMLLGHSTIPVGLNNVLRTLVSHGGVSHAEARSFLHLAERENHTLYEPLSSAEEHFARQFTDAARELRAGASPTGIVVIAPEPLQGIFAQALTNYEPLSEVFPDGGVVRALRPTHLMPYLAAHAQMPDFALMIEALFVDARLGSL
jgi:hypothetical protein